MVSASTLIKKAFSAAAPASLALATPALAQDEAARITPLLYVPPARPPALPITPQFQDTQEIVAGKTYTVTARVHAAFENAQLPKAALIATCARESSCDPGATNPTSKACGLFQLMTDERTATLYEAVFNYGAQYGYAAEAAMVRRELLGYFSDGEPRYGYYPVTPEAKKHLIEKCADPKFNTDMHEGYTMPKVLAFREQFGREMTYGDLAGANNWGFKGWKLIVEQVEADKVSRRDTMATSFFAQRRNIFGGIAGNRSMLYTGKRALTMTEAYEKLVAHGGDIVIELPRAEPVLVLTLAKEETITIVPDASLLLARIPKPEFRN